MTAVVTEREEFDIKASARKIAHEGQSIQQLIRHYEQSTRRLQNDIAQHVRNEMEEANSLALLETNVAEAELLYLHNRAYMLYSHQNDETAISSESILPTSRMRQSGGVETSQKDFTKDSWLFRLRSSAFSHWAPDSGSLLKAHGDIREVLVGWRKRNQKLDKSFKSMCEQLFDTLPPLKEQALPTARKYVCLFNGLPFTPRSLANIKDGLELCGQLSFLRGQFQSIRSIEEIVATMARSYANNIIDRSSLTKHDFWEALWLNYDFKTLSTLGAVKGSKIFYNNFIPNLQCDVHDSVVLVHPSRLRDSQMFRGFFIRSKLVAVEHVGIPVNISRLLSLEKDESVENVNNNVNKMYEIAQLFFKIFLSINENAKTTPMSTVMTIAFKYNLTHPPSNVDPAALFQAGVVLDVRPITPSLPFCWHFTWAEICALGQMNQHERITRINPDPEDVVFKVTDVSVSSLLEYDTLSTLAFPTINHELNKQLRVGPQAVSSYDVPPKDSKQEKNLLPTYPVFVAVGATLILFGIALRALLQINKNC